MPVVLDASAALAYLKGENGGSVVRQRIIEASPKPNGYRAIISALNVTEIHEQLHPDPRAAEWVDSLLEIVEVIPYAGLQILSTAALRPTTRHLGLSLADRACLSLAKDTGSPALTADLVWSDVDIGVDVIQIRPRRG